MIEGICGHALPKEDGGRELPGDVVLVPQHICQSLSRGRGTDRCARQPLGVGPLRQTERPLSYRVYHLSEPPVHSRLFTACQIHSCGLKGRRKPAQGASPGRAIESPSRVPKRPEGARETRLRRRPSHSILFYGHSRVPCLSLPTHLLAQRPQGRRARAL